MRQELGGARIVTYGRNAIGGTPKICIFIAIFMPQSRSSPALVCIIRMLTGHQSFHLQPFCA